MSIWAAQIGPWGVFFKERKEDTEMGRIRWNLGRVKGEGLGRVRWGSGKG